MSILDKVVKIEKRLERLAARKDAPTTAIEVRRAILDDVEDQVRPAGRSRRVFPYTRIAIEVLGGADTKTVETGGATGPLRPSRAELEAVLDPDEGLVDAIRERLQEAGCDRVGRLDVSVKVLKKPRADWGQGQVLRVTYERTEADRGLRTGPTQASAAPSGGLKARPAARPADSAGARHGLPPREPSAAIIAQIVVLEGDATKKTYTLSGDRTNIGRQAEVTDKHQRVVRRNQVVFTDTDSEANQTVSRAQAHIRFTPPDEYRLFDDHSSYGTRIVRAGKMIELPSGSPRGVKLCAGDEIYLGRARVAFQIR